MIDGAVGQLAVADQMQQPGFHLFRRQLCWALVVERGQFGDDFEVGLPGTLGEAAHEHGVVHLVT